MTTKFFFTAMLFMSLTTGMNANDAYEQAMQEALEKMGQAQTIEDLIQSANRFEMISKAADDQWLPLYYHALNYIRITFMSTEDAAKRDAYLDKAQLSVDRMIEIDENESEIYALQSMLHTARLVIDPMNRGQSMMVKSGEAISRSLELNPKNPRAAYLFLSNEVGQAQFFGKDVSEFCPRINELYSQWDALNENPRFYPNWGKNEVKGLAGQCE